MWTVSLLLASVRYVVLCTAAVRLRTVFFLKRYLFKQTRHNSSTVGACWHEKYARCGQQHLLQNDSFTAFHTTGKHNDNINYTIRKMSTVKLRFHPSAQLDHISVCTRCGMMSRKNKALTRSFNTLVLDSSLQADAVQKALLKNADDSSSNVDSRAFQDQNQEACAGFRHGQYGQPCITDV